MIKQLPIPSFLGINLSSGTGHRVQLHTAMATAATQSPVTDQAGGQLPSLYNHTNGEARKHSINEVKSVEALNGVGHKLNGKGTPGTLNKSPYELPTLPLVDKFIDEPRPLRVAVIGGGLSGVLSGALLPKKVPSIKLTIFEKNGDFVSSLDGGFLAPCRWLVC